MHVAFGVFAGGVFAWVFLRIAWVFLRISSSTPQNCATTNRFFVNEKRLVRNGIRYAQRRVFADVPVRLGNYRIKLLNFI